ncbi:MAG TPA: hypothetical protein VIU61_18190 [Kofleriaceae bacterium]
MTSYRQSTTEADDRIRAALAAVAERARLVGIRDALAPDLAEIEADTAKLERALAREQKDVRRYEKGAWAFLYDVFADREARLTKEQHEAMAAETKYAEASAARDRLREEISSIGQRIAALDGADTELTAARAQKRSALIAIGGPAAEELDGITSQVAAIDADLRAVDEAIAAGQRAQAAVGQLATVLRSASNWGTADILTGAFFISWTKRNKLDEARSLAGTAQGELTVFRRELADVGVGLVTEIEGLADHHRFLDVWFDNIFSDFSVQGRIEKAEATTGTALDQVNHALAALMQRRATLVDRREQLLEQRVQLIEAT